MNKNQLREQNLYLFDRLQKAERLNKKLNQQILELQSRIDNLTAQLDSENLADIAHEDISQNLTEDVTEKANISKPDNKDEVVLSEDVNFASQIIGEIVVRASFCSNQLKELGKTNVKELLNLILGRTEVSKGEILNIISSDVSDDAKKEMILAVRDEVFEYFKSVLEQ